MKLIEADLARDPDPVTNFEVARESPVLRMIVEDNLSCFIAVEEPSSWEGGPQDALQWESFIQQISGALTGNRSPLGGGAWNNSRKSIAAQTLPMVRVRLADLRSQGLI